LVDRFSRTDSHRSPAAVVAEIVASGDSVCAVARRHGLSPQQLFGWRRQLRESAKRHSEAEELQFVPATVDVAAAGVRGRRKAPRWKSEPDAGAIEVEVNGVTIRVGRGADANTIAATVHALKASR
jgi:transposase